MFFCVCENMWNSSYLWAVMSSMLPDQSIFSTVDGLHHWNGWNGMQLDRSFRLSYPKSLFSLLDKSVYINLRIYVFQRSKCHVKTQRSLIWMFWLAWSLHITQKVSKPCYRLVHTRVITTSPTPGNGHLVSQLATIPRLRLVEIRPRDLMLASDWFSSWSRDGTTCRRERSWHLASGVCTRHCINKEK